MSAVHTTPLIYNLFPRHFKSIDDWSSAVPHIRDTGFTWVFVNPFHATGFSGSLYAVQDYYKLNPYFLKMGQDPHDWTPLRNFIHTCGAAGLRVVMDLVINHTAIDSPLIEQHPAWYLRDDDGKVKRPSAFNVEDGTTTVWGDLAEIDNDNSPELESLWQYWDDLIAFYQQMGITVFRCDAAYQIPAKLWQHLTCKARERFPESVFLAETLGCTPKQAEALIGTGFNYLFNSSKYWNFDESWCLEQHERYQKVAPTISFPESHDTPRLASEDPGHENWQRNRYALAALFSKGLMMTAGYEYGATTAMNVVNGTPADVDEPQWDLSQWIAAVNAFKLSKPVLQQEGHWKVLSSYEGDLLFLEKNADDNASAIALVINKNPNQKRQVHRSEFPSKLHNLHRYIRIFGLDFTPQPLSELIELDAAEMVILEN